MNISFLLSSPFAQDSDPLLDLDLEGINITTEDDFFLDEAAGMRLRGQCGG